MEHAVVVSVAGVVGGVDEVRTAWRPTKGQGVEQGLGRCPSSTTGDKQHAAVADRVQLGAALQCAEPKRFALVGVRDQNVAETAPALGPDVELQ